MVYVTLPRQSSSSFLSFIFGSVKWILSYFFLLFSSIQVRGTLLFFLFLLFGLRGRSDIYHLESFYITAFCIPMLEHVLYKIYNYVFIKHVDFS